MRHGGVRSRATATVAGVLLLAALSACVGPDAGRGGGSGAAGAEGSAVGSPTALSRAPAPGAAASRAAAPTRIPDIGDRLHRRIPATSRQVLAVYGDGADSAESTAVLYTRRGPVWERVRRWPAHNGKKGWTPDHRLGDNRSPVGVFTLTAAGGVLDDPGTRLPYTRSEDYAAPRRWDASHWHDFDYVIAIDYNRVPGTPPDDGEQPWGEEKGGGIWLHLDHGDGTSACVSLSKEAMEFLLLTLDPEHDPVVVMGDRDALKA
ncbi:L,D-transpeptidase family protein [Streptomyces sp. NBC_00582]|uniref:L,D-transpeptidase family protein n=1 Tax=Streptomyces sp. NBC_00582 TaxID=2975783 RepID=UPI002E81B5A6|nr:L,D-transpeptidase family protein [Streptomyces sp. NBC_00582]WUB66475.1 L,D-transpeptidase family protein [Streptomyces sp. NBC_00582]